MILGESEVGDDKLERFQYDFQRLVSQEEFTINTEVERLLIYDEIQRCFTAERLGGLHGGTLCVEGLRRVGSMQINWDESDLWHADWVLGPRILFTHPNRRETARMANDYWDFWERIIEKTPAQIHAENIDVSAQEMEIIKFNTLSEVLAPAVGKVSELGYRNKAAVEATITIIAVLRYKKDKGGYPAELDELVEGGYLKELPMDPYSDKALVYKKTDEGFTLYSVGANFADDGGKVVTKKDGKVKRWGEDDAVFWPIR